MPVEERDIDRSELIAADEGLLLRHRLGGRPDPLHRPRARSAPGAPGPVTSGSSSSTYFDVCEGTTGAHCTRVADARFTRPKARPPQPSRRLGEMSRTSTAGISQPAMPF